MEKNRLLLRGKMSTPLYFSHELYGEKFYNFFIEIERLSGVMDTVEVQVSERLLCAESFDEGDFVEVKGQLRSYNQFISESKSRLKIYGFAKEIKKIEEETYTNEISLKGFLCKDPVYRTTPFDRKISDLLIAVNTTNYRSDYIPCIVWGRNAIYIEQFAVGTGVELKGRIQSRKYNKLLENGECEQRIAYELSCNLLEIM